MDAAVLFPVLAPPPGMIGETGCPAFFVIGGLDTVKARRNPLPPASDVDKGPLSYLTFYMFFPKRSSGGIGKTFLTAFYRKLS
jgi:hypothetical protein